MTEANANVGMGGKLESIAVTCSVCGKTMRATVAGNRLKVAIGRRRIRKWNEHKAREAAEAHAPA
jgi:hypothetical protein